jgi:peptide/nickel transport system substrate-binding protein
LVTFILIIGIVSIYPFIDFFTFKKKEIIGLLQTADIRKLPLEITSKISNGLFYLNEKGELIPILVSHWEKSKDGLIYRFYLKKNIYWSDGKPFTSKDITYEFKDIEKKIIDDYTIDFILKKRLDIFPLYLTQPLIRYPLIGIGGMYKVSKMTVNKGRLTKITLFPYDLKNNSIIVYKFFNNENQMIVAYKKGEINKMRVSKKTIADFFKNWKNTQVKQEVNYQYLLTMFFNFNNQIFKEKDFRQAIISGIDFNYFKDYGEIANTPYSPYHFVYNSQLKKYYYDPDKSKKIIENFKEKNKIALELDTYSEFYDIAEYIASELKKVGLEIKINILNYELPSNFDLFLAYLDIPNDPDQYYFWHSTQKKTNIGNYSNVRVDKLLEDGRSILDKNQRREIYLKLQEILQNDPPAIFLFFPYTYLIERK